MNSKQKLEQLFPKKTHIPQMYQIPASFDLARATVNYNMNIWF